MGLRRTRGAHVRKAPLAPFRLSSALGSFRFFRLRPGVPRRKAVQAPRRFGCPPSTHCRAGMSAFDPNLPFRCLRSLCSVGCV
jgi:hypothetical protein